VRVRLSCGLLKVGPQSPAPNHRYSL